MLIISKSIEKFAHSEDHHWRLVYNTFEMDEPGHDVSIRENKKGAKYLQVVDKTNKIVRTVNLKGGWLPIWYRCRGFDQESSKTKCIVFGRGFLLDDGIQIELESILDGKWIDHVPEKYINKLAIHTQLIKLKG